MRAKVDFITRTTDGTACVIVTVADRYRVAATYQWGGRTPHKWEIDDLATAQVVDPETSHGQMIVNSARTAIDHFGQTIKARGARR